MKPTDIKVTPSFSRTTHPMLTLTVTENGYVRTAVSFAVYMMDVKTRGWIASVLKRQLRDTYICGYNVAKGETYEAYVAFRDSMSRCTGAL